MDKYIQHLQHECPFQSKTVPPQLSPLDVLSQAVQLHTAADPPQNMQGLTHTELQTATESILQGTAQPRLDGASEVSGLPQKMFVEVAADDNLVSVETVHEASEKSAEEDTNYLELLANQGIHITNEHSTKGECPGEELQNHSQEVPYVGDPKPVLLAEVTYGEHGRNKQITNCLKAGEVNCREDASAQILKLQVQIQKNKTDLMLLQEKLTKQTKELELKSQVLDQYCETLTPDVTTDNERKVNEKGNKDDEKQGSDKEEERVMVDCYLCEKTFWSGQDIERHNVTIEHMELVNLCCGNRLLEEGVQHVLLSYCKFECRICSFYCQRYEDIQSHLMTADHTKAVRDHKHPLLCQLCNVQFAENRSVRRHLKSDGHLEKMKTNKPCVISRALEKTEKVSVNKETMCPVCDWSGNSNAQLQQHVHDIHQDTIKLKMLNNELLINMPQKVKKKKIQKYSCKFCTYCTKNWKQFRQHMFDLHYSDIPQCSICDRRFADTHRLNVHLQLKHKVKNMPPQQQTQPTASDKACSIQFYCRECGMQFKEEKQKVLHEFGHTHYMTEEAAQKAEPCFGIPERFHGFVHRISSVGKNDQVTCPQCGQTRIKHCIYSHLRKHDNLTPFKCTLCTSTFSSGDGLRCHLKYHLGLKKKPDSCKCDLCDKSYCKLSHLKLHKLRDHGMGKVDDVLCSVCGRCFYTKGQLARHLNDCHEPKLQCPISGCDRSFTRKQTLEKHIQTPHGDYKCLRCNYQTSNKQNLIKHQKLHSATGKFKCQYCDYESVVQCAVVRHQLCHFNIYPYKCRVCTYKCKETFALKLHYKRHHPRNHVFLCTHCDFGCHGSRAFRQHLVDTHSLADQEINIAMLYAGLLTHDKIEPWMKPTDVTKKRKMAHTTKTTRKRRKQAKQDTDSSESIDLSDSEATDLSDSASEKESESVESGSEEEPADLSSNNVLEEFIPMEEGPLLSQDDPAREVLPTLMKEESVDSQIHLPIRTTGIEIKQTGNTGTQMQKVEGAGVDHREFDSTIVAWDDDSSEYITFQQSPMKTADTWCEPQSTAVIPTAATLSVEVSSPTNHLQQFPMCLPEVSSKEETHLVVSTPLQSPGYTQLVTSVPHVTGQTNKPKLYHAQTERSSQVHTIKNLQTARKALQTTLGDAVKSDSCRLVGEMAPAPQRLVQVRSPGVVISDNANRTVNIQPYTKVVRSSDQQPFQTPVKSEGRTDDLLGIHSVAPRELEATFNTSSVVKAPTIQPSMVGHSDKREAPVMMKSILRQMLVPVTTARQKLPLVHSNSSPNDLTIKGETETTIVSSQRKEMTEAQPTTNQMGAKHSRKKVDPPTQQVQDTTAKTHISKVTAQPHTSKPSAKFQTLRLYTKPKTPKLGVKVTSIKAEMCSVESGMALIAPAEQDMDSVGLISTEEMERRMVVGNVLPSSVTHEDQCKAGLAHNVSHNPQSNQEQTLQSDVVPKLQITKAQDLPESVTHTNEVDSEEIVTSDETVEEYGGELQTIKAQAVPQSVTHTNEADSEQIVNSAETVEESDGELMPPGIVRVEQRVTSDGQIQLMLTGDTDHLTDEQLAQVMSDMFST